MEKNKKMTMNNTGTEKSARRAFALTLAASLAASVFAGSATGATNLFENSSDVKKFRGGLRKDLFYLEGEKLSSAASEQPAQKKPETPPEKDTSEVSASARYAGTEENFKVEGIIKIGEKGCAIINSRIWYIGRPNMGYELVKLYDEMVEIKTPDGRILKCRLIKEKKIDQY